MKLLIALLCALMGLTTAAEHDVVKRSSSCPSGFRWYSGRCFRYASHPMTWSSAQRFCQSMDANLPSVHSLKQYQLIQRVIYKNTRRNPRVWLGGSDAQQERTWLWVDGTRFNYSKWCYGEPNNFFGLQHCIQMNYSGGLCWDDHACFVKLPFVCVI